MSCLREFLADQRAQHVVVLLTPGVRIEDLAVEFRRIAEQRLERLPMSVGGPQRIDVAVAARQRFEPDLHVGALPAERNADVRIRRHLELRGVHRRLPARRVDPLAVAGRVAMEQRHHRRGGRVGRTHHLGRMTGRAQRIFLADVIDQRGRVVAGQTHRAFDEVGALPIAIRTGLPERRDRGDDQPRIQRVQSLVAETEALEIAGPMILDEDVGVGDQALEDLGAARRRRIEGQAFLAGVEVEKEAALLGMRHVARIRRMAARLVAAPGRLDLDDLGAHVGEHLAAHRTRDHLGVLDYPQVVQRRVRQLGSSLTGRVSGNRAARRHPGGL